MSRLTAAPDQLRILQITNHGLHEWDVTPGLPDTGGQNVFVNNFSAALVRLGHRVTIVNRGGYPHPLTGEPRIGTVERFQGRAAIVYLSDGTPSFVRKEDMAPQLPGLADSLLAFMSQRRFDMIISHYWDGAMLGVLANRRLPTPLPHIWIPHSLGTLKQRNVDPETWPRLRIGERIRTEREILTEIDGVATTSITIRNSLIDDYGYRPQYFLPPGIDQDRFHPRSPEECSEIFDFLAAKLGMSPVDTRTRPLILEVSRTDLTKRKGVLIEAFARLRIEVPDALLAVSIDPINPELYERYTGLIGDLGLAGSVAVLGSVWDELPCLYAMSSVYCTPSIMEGFGMSAQEAAASGVPVVASQLVPFVTEHLLGDQPELVPFEGGGRLQVGAGAIVVPADSVEGFAAALGMVLRGDDLRRRLGREARAITVPAFGWDRLAAGLMNSIATGSSADEQ